MNEVQRVNKKVLKDMSILLRNHNLEPKDFDLEQMIGKNETEHENKQIIAKQVGIPLNPMGTGYKVNTEQRVMSQSSKHAKIEMDEQTCGFLVKKCEEQCNNNACRMYKKECKGDVDPCPKTPTARKYNATARRSGTNKGDCPVKFYCVEAHTRPPQHNSRTGNPIQVARYCVQQHPRLCRRNGYD